MKDPQENGLLLTPAPCGWRARTITARGEWMVEDRGSFAEALEAGWTLTGEPKRRAKPIVEVAIPAHLGVFERLTLPSVDREELGSMVRLQFEKNLPYSIEETSLEFQILSQTETETTLMACAVHEPDLTTLCAPLLERVVPRRLTFWSLQVAAQAGNDDTACGFWREEDRLIFGIFEKQRLGFIEMLSGGNDLRSALPSVLMQAEIAGAPAEFSEVLLDPALREASDALVEFFKAPVRLITADGCAVEDVDLTPRQWREEEARKGSHSRLRHQIILAALVYVALLSAGFVCLGMQNRRLGILRGQAAAWQPKVDAVIERQARWKALAPAVDKRQFALEQLFQAWQCLPSPDVHITRFELATNQMTLEGEAPNAQQAIQFAEKLKARPELAGYRFEGGPPAILSNEHAQFRIFGKP
ncbi:MAG: hypothetical protein ACFUZC_15190 [Chthoniobacteraceae bacterium]